MTEPAVFAHLDQRSAASQDALAHVRAEFDRVTAGLRVGIAVGRITRH